MIPEPDEITVVDARATKRARRLVLALNDLEARGKLATPEYSRLKAELDSLSKPKRAGTTIKVPRI